MAGASSRRCALIYLVTIHFLQRSAGSRPPLNKIWSRRSLSSPFLFFLLPARRPGGQAGKHWIAIAFHPRNTRNTPHHLSTEAAAEHALHHATHLGVLLDQ